MRNCWLDECSHKIRPFHAKDDGENEKGPRPWYAFLPWTIERVVRRHDNDQDNDQEITTENYIIFLEMVSSSLIYDDIPYNDNATKPSSL